MHKFNHSKTPHIHLDDNSIVRLDTLEDIKTGKKYTQLQINKLKEVL
tara:strand:+ start:788 stop:928 length:141 start_codon:yes stop_codon:yes gene_type:complete